MPTFYGTFGYGQSLCNNYVKFEAPDIGAAHAEMHRVYGSVWAFVYTEQAFVGQEEKYHITEVPLGTRNTYR